MFLSVRQFLKFKKSVKTIFYNLLKDESLYTQKECTSLFNKYLNKTIKPWTPDFKEKLSEQDYIYLSSILITDFSYSEITSGNHLSISGNLNDTGLVLKEIHEYQLAIAEENGWITEQEKIETLEVTRRKIRSSWSLSDWIN